MRFREKKAGRMAYTRRKYEGDRLCSAHRQLARYLAKESTVPEGGDLPPADPILGEYGRKDEIENVRLGRAEAAGRRKNWRVVFIAKQHEVTWLDGSQESLDLRA